MIIKEKVSEKVRAHTRYKLRDGTLVPGVTTITGQLDKPALKLWANRLGLQGIDVTKYTDEKAEIGTLAHYMVLCHLRSEKPKTDEYSQLVIDKAENCFLSYLNWEKQHEIAPLHVEMPLVSEIYRYGGTADFYGIVDGVEEIIDFKTGSGIYPEYWLQVSGYDSVIREAYPEAKINRYRILNIPRIEDESFKEEVKTSVTMEFNVFRHLLSVYWLRKEIKIREG